MAAPSASRSASAFHRLASDRLAPIAAALGLFATVPLAAEELPPPNLLWITAEDMSPTLGCYGDAYATTPNIDRFAAESVRYTRAFAAAPVCSPARATLITGMWAPSLGISQMRSAYPVPDEVRGFPVFLRERGYFTTNNVKTDYNNAAHGRMIDESWHHSSVEAHWRSDGREEGQPFFAVFNHMVSHQSRTMVWDYEDFEIHVQSQLSAQERHDPATAPLPPYYPDTETVRRTVARYYDCVSVLDREVARLLEQLEEDGLAEDTIVFFYSDHGSGMPRHKRLLHDSGMQVPLLIRFPEKYRHLAPAGPGESVDRLVTFVDFPPTVLALAGAAIPDYMQGSIFLGPESTEEPEYVYGFRDRVDEVHELTRSVRSADHLYIRNYHPHLSWSQPSTYCRLGEIQRDIAERALADPESLTEAQLAYAGAGKEPEEFYEVAADPHNVRNLLLVERTPEQEAALERARAEYRRQRLEILDLGFVPEPILQAYVEEEDAPARTIATGGTDHRPDLEAIYAAADLVGFGTREELLELTRSGDAAVRYWGLVGLRFAHRDDADLHDLLSHLMADYDATVRIEAASWFAEASDKLLGEALDVLAAELDHEAWWTALRATRAIELLGETARPLLERMREHYWEHRHGEGDGPFFLAFSAGSFLEAMGEPTEPWDFAPR